MMAPQGGRPGARGLEGCAAREVEDLRLVGPPSRSWIRELSKLAPVASSGASFSFEVPGALQPTAQQKCTICRSLSRT